MITIPPTHIALNDPRAPAFAHMRYSYRVGETESRESIVQRVVRAAKLFPAKRIHNVVVSCHGNPGQLQLGEGFETHHAALFAAWRDKVDRVWLRACRVARNDAFGHSLARGMARAAGCYVVASTELQTEVGLRRLPYGRLDTPEGLLVCFAPSGRVEWESRFPSTYYIARRQEWHRNPD